MRHRFIFPKKCIAANLLRWNLPTKAYKFFQELPAKAYKFLSYFDEQDGCEGLYYLSLLSLIMLQYL